MNQYILFMHNDATDRAAANDDQKWGEYLSFLRHSGSFDGGSSIGTGECVNRDGKVVGLSTQLTGFVRVRAESLHDAKRFLAGNPVHEAGGTVEIRELLQE